MSSSKPRAAEVDLELKACVHNFLHHALPSHDPTLVSTQVMRSALAVPGLHREKFICKCLRLLKRLGDVHGAPSAVSHALNLAHDFLEPVIFDMQPGLEIGICQLFMTKRISLAEEEMQRSVERRDAESLYNLRKLQCVKLVEEYSQIEERLEELLKAEQDTLRRQQHLLRETRLEQMELEKAQARQEGLMQKISQITLDVQRQGQVAYELRTEAKTQDDEVEAIRKSCRNERLRIQAAMDKVPKSVLVSAEEALRTRTQLLTQMEGSNHVLQEKLLKLTHALEREEAEMEIVKQKQQAAFEQEDDFNRSLTPRPDWEGREIYKRTRRLDHFAQKDSWKSSTEEHVEALCEYLEKHRLDGPELYRVQQENLELQGKIMAVNAKLEETEAIFSKNNHTELPGIGVVRLNTDTKTRDKRQTIQPLGKDQDIPPFLRTDRPVPLRLMEEGEMLTLVNDVLRTKMIKDEEARGGKAKGSEISLGEHFYLFLKNLYGVQNVIVRVSYNLFYSMRNLPKQENPDVEIFALTLSKDLPESTYSQQQLMTKQLITLCGKIKQAEGVKRDVLELSKSTFLALLSEYFPKMNSEELQELQDTVEIQSPGEVVDYTTLLASDGTNTKTEPAKRGSTVRRTVSLLLKKHHLANVKKSWYSFREILRLACNSGAGDFVTSDTILAILKRVDPLMQDTELIEHLCSAMGSTRRGVLHHFEAGLLHNKSRGATEPMLQAPAEECIERLRQFPGLTLGQVHARKTDGIVEQLLSSLVLAKAASCPVRTKKQA